MRDVECHDAPLDPMLHLATGLPTGLLVAKHLPIAVTPPLASTHAVPRSEQIEARERRAPEVYAFVH
jgi:siroheme synthase